MIDGFDLDDGARRSRPRGRRGRAVTGAGLLLALVASLALVGAEGCSRRSPPSVVLVVIDTLRADHLGSYGYERPTSPHLDRFAAGAALFERAFTTSPWTLPAFGTLYTGLLPSVHGAGSVVADDEASRPTARLGKRDFVRLREEVPTLAGRLRTQGYRTAAFANNIFLDPRFGLARGFDEYDYEPSTDWEIRRADATVDAVLDWLDASASAAGGDAAPVFLMVHFFDPHRHYDAPEPVRGTFTGELEDRGYGDGIESRLQAAEAADLEFVVAAYDEEILFVDRQFQRLVEGLAERGIGDEALFVVTADHGEEFLDHGDAGHGHTLYQELLRVPLIVRGPGIDGGRYDAPASLADLYPTVLEAAGIEPRSERPLAGRSLRPLLAGGSLGRDGRRRLLFAEGMLYGEERKALIRWPYKLIFDPEGEARRLYDLEDDPGETDDLAARGSPEYRALVHQLQAAWAGRPAGARGPGEQVELDPATRRNLRALGYIQ